METMELYRGRLIDHVQLVVADLEASWTFYAAIMNVLGIEMHDEREKAQFFWADELAVSSQDSEAAIGKLTGRVHLAFQAKDRAMVEAAYRAALDAGGKDNGSPGERDYHPGYYAGFMLDPDGNNIEVVHHGEARFSAPYVKVEF